MEGIGLSITKDAETIQFGVTTFPDRKNPCLYILKGNVITPLAYFKNENKAKDFCEIIELLANAFNINR